MAAKTYTFHNITVHVQAETAKEAYYLLDDVLSDNLHTVLSYETDTYSQGDGEKHDTLELF